MRYIDTHSHIAPDVGFEEVIKSIDANGVSHIVIMPRGGSREYQVIEFYEKYSDRVIPFYGGETIQALLMEGSNESISKEGVRTFQGYCHDWWEKSIERSIEQIERDIAAGPYKGIGEIRLRHYGAGPRKPEGPDNYNFSADTPFMFRLADLAAKLHLPIAIHMEAESKGEYLKGLGKVATEDTIPAFERLLDHNEDALIIWCHLGRAAPEIIKQMLDKHPNLYTDISDVQPKGDNAKIASPELVGLLQRFTLKNPITDENGRLGEEWKQIFVSYSDRIMIGCDAATLRLYGRMYSASLGELRNVLSQLTPEAAERIAYQNAKKIFGID